MKVKLGKNHISYLVNNLYQEQESFKNILIQISDEIPSVIIEVDDDSADAIRDWAGEQLQKIGFDINYELDYEGKIFQANRFLKKWWLRFMRNVTVTDSLWLCIMEGEKN